MRSSARLALIALLVGGVGGWGGGCARTTVERSLVSMYDEPDQELDYFAELEEQRVVSNDDALHALLLLAEPGGAYETYEERADAARERGWIEGEAPPATESARIGMVAVAVCEVLGIEGGLSMHLFGNTPRYATRELIYEGLLPPRTEEQSISGIELVDLIGRVDRRSEAR